MLHTENKIVSNRQSRFYRTLAFQVMVFIALVLFTTAFIQYFYAEDIIETTMLDEVKKQALVLLHGVEQQVRTLADPYDSATLSAIFRKTLEHDVGELNFAIINIYMYDKAGNVIAYSNKPDQLKKDLASHYGEVLISRKPYMGADVEEKHVGGAGKVITSTDVVIPVHYGSDVIGGIEVEIDLEKTLAIIKKTDSRYEDRIFVMLSIAIVLSLVLIWLIMRWHLVSPVRKLGAITAKIAEGDLKARVRSSSQNEIGLLSASVDKMADSIQDLFQQLDMAYIGILSSLSVALEARDDYTAHHSDNVTRYSLILGQSLGLDEESLKRLAQGAQLHDLGKIGIPDNILKKPDHLTAEEREIVQNHTRVTSEILRPIEKFKHFSDIARSHHERWDGRGYPDGLKGEEIPPLARIVAIADTWDSMTTDRFYRKGMSKSTALSILEREKSDGQWDPGLLNEFLRLMKQGSNSGKSESLRTDS